MLTSRGWRVSPPMAFVVLVVAVVAFLLTNSAWDADPGDGSLGAGTTTVATPPPASPTALAGTTAP